MYMLITYRMCVSDRSLEVHLHQVTYHTSIRLMQSYSLLARFLLLNPLTHHELLSLLALVHAYAPVSFATLSQYFFSEPILF